MGLTTLYKISSFHKRLLNLTVIACTSAFMEEYSNKHMFMTRVTNLRLTPNRVRKNYISLLKAPHIHKDARNAFARPEYNASLRLMFLLRKLNIISVGADTLFNALYKVVNNYFNYKIKLFSSLPYANSTACAHLDVS